jgi:2-dehydro-3-deoxyphosphogluconate aldolase/(4S)-4-hydroxy-2-oxoglutarate aldolase
MRYVPTGGITPENAAEYLGERSVAAVGGTWLATHDVVAAREWETIRRLAAEAAAMVSRVRSTNASRPATVRQPA